MTAMALMLAVAPAMAKKSSAPNSEVATKQAASKPAVNLEPWVRDSFKPPLPKVVAKKGNPITQAKVDLGRMLYYETRLSKNHDVSCNTCHLLDKYGVDGLATSIGHKKQKGGRNAPTVYNAAGHIAQFWDGRAKDLEEQAKGPVLNPIEMAMPSEAHAVEVLKSIPGYHDAFKLAFPKVKDPITYDNMANAIGAFERKLLTPTRFDDYVGGDEDALTDAEKLGLQTFVQTGCVACHNGPYVGTRIYQKLGLIKPWPVEPGKELDKGRFEVTKLGADMHVFKVPSLRNIEKTGPYLHNGSIKDLAKMVRLMARHQLGRELNDEQVKSIVTFLKALTGPLPTEYIKKPKLPKSGPDTPKPDPS